MWHVDTELWLTTDNRLITQANIERWKPALVRILMVELFTDYIRLSVCWLQINFANTHYLRHAGAQFHGIAPSASAFFGLIFFCTLSLSMNPVCGNSILYVTWTVPGRKVQLQIRHLGYGLCTFWSLDSHKNIWCNGRFTKKGNKMFCINQKIGFVLP